MANYLAFKIFIEKETNLKFIEEYQFCDGRKWRFDLANIENKIAIEIEGGVYANGRHTRASGFIKDMEKYNNATALGWRLIRVTPDSLTNAIKFVKKML